MPPSPCDRPTAAGAREIARDCALVPALALTLAAPLAGALAIGAFPGAVRAQAAPSLELGFRQWTLAGRATQAPVVAAAGALAWKPVQLSADGALALDDSPTRLLGGHLSTVLALPRLGAIRPEVGGRVERDPADTAHGRPRLEAGGRLWLERRSGGAWIGAGAVRRQGSGRPGAEVSAGVWRTVGPALLSATVRRHTGAGASTVSLGGPDSTPAMSCETAAKAGSPRAAAACSRRAATDAEAGARWRLWRAELEATLGTRLTRPMMPQSTPAASGGAARRVWAGGTVALPFTPTMTALAAVRQLPADAARGLPDRTTVSFGVSLRPGAPREPARRAPPARATRPARSPQAPVTVGPPAADGLRALRLVVPGARQVEVRGSMTDWEAVPLASVDGRTWEARFPLPDGVYQLTVRVDGGEWRVPAGVPTADDGFGGEVGVLVVEGGSR